MLNRFAFLRPLLLIGALAVAGLVMITAAAFLYIDPQLPKAEALRDVELQTPLRIYSKDGQLIGEFGEKRRTPISIQEVPELAIKAFLAAEDDRFFQHRGVDPAGLLRAALQLITSGDIKSGGSTITMQVAKNYFLTRDKTFTRKFTEIFLAIEIERRLSKGDILELYLNKIFLGHHAYGIEAAAYVYYGKPIKELNLAQIAMIAGLPKAPSAYNPIANPSRARVRRNWILGRMLELDYIDDQQYQAALHEPITARAHGAKLDLNAAYVAEMIRIEMLRRYGQSAYEEGFTVITSIDSKLQKTAQQAVLDGVTEYDLRHGYRGPEQQWPLPETLDEESVIDFRSRLNAIGPIGPWLPALIISNTEKTATALLAGGEHITLDWEHSFEGMDRYISEDRVSYKAKNTEELVKPGDVVRLRRHPSANEQWRLSQLPEVQGALISLNADNGAILSLVGGYDYEKSSFNRATQAARQPGSNFKPFIYTAGLDNGFTPASIINDAPIVFEDEKLGGTWRPDNDSGTFSGPMRLRKALYLSRNLVSIRLLQQLGIRTAIDYVGRFGFDSSQLPLDLSLALGSHSLSMIDIVTGYATFANGGYKVKPWVMDRIIDRNGNTLYRANPAQVCDHCDALANNEQEFVPAHLEMESLDDLLNSEEEELLSLNQAPRILSEQTTFLIDSMLQDVVRKGTGRKALALNRSDAAGKTGTTNGPTDAWFSGYSSGVVTSTWAGFDDNKKLGRREYGGSVALPIWIDYMKVALEGRTERHLPQPQGVVSVKIDPDNGKLASPGQSNAIFEYFKTENAPEAQSRSGNYPGQESQESPYDIF
ncbi:penicillin-binding protein 1A [Spongiibacter sp. KMU-158]|uniref:Penicillin-binding protein 1A n=1 Tax=Spongiibacter pelagi TaxID=2760804 RepID=A0A927BYM3_9GAMM|nr:penicillin-binding protein 1A [Spongiibacter pelagi]MBD2857969.1 penicillin-binding protein 1A [Spongiibacter pelagi]